MDSRAREAPPLQGEVDTGARLHRRVSILVLHAQDNLSLGDIGFGVLLASAAVGGILGAQVAPTVIARLGRRSGVLSSVVALSGGVAIMGAANNLWPAVAGYAMFGFAGEIWNVVSVTSRQSVTPDELLSDRSCSPRLM